jgi:hypothetical protein
MKSKEQCEEKPVGLADLSSAWILVLMVFIGMNAVLTLGGS